MKKHWKGITVSLIIMVSILLGMYALKINKKQMPNNAVKSSNEKIIQKVEGDSKTIKPNVKDEFISNEYHPIIFVWKNVNDKVSGGSILGGCKNGKWFNISDFDVNFKGKVMKSSDFKNKYFEINPNGESASTDLAKGDEVYKFYSNTSLITTAKSEKSELHVAGSTGDEYIDITYNPQINIKEEFFIGINGNWNALPRIMKPLNEKDSYSIDLDNDGIDEIISIRDSNFKDENSGKDVNGKIFTVEKKGQKILNEEIPIDGIYIGNYKMAVLDLNGDGTMEVVTAALGHNTSVTAYEIKDGKAEAVLDYYSGD